MGSWWKCNAPILYGSFFFHAGPSLWSLSSQTMKLTAQSVTQRTNKINFFGVRTGTVGNLQRVFI